MARLSVDCKGNARRLCDLLKRHLHSLTLFEPRPSPTSTNNNNDNASSANNNGEDVEETDIQTRCKIFRQFGGVDVLIDVIMSTARFPEGTSAADETKPTALLRAKSLACEILARLVVMTLDGDEVAEQLAARDDLLLYLFRLLPLEKICITATDLIEVGRKRATDGLMRFSGGGGRMGRKY